MKMFGATAGTAGLTGCIGGGGGNESGTNSEDSVDNSNTDNGGESVDRNLRYGEDFRVNDELEIEPIPLAVGRQSQPTRDVLGFSVYMGGDLSEDEVGAYMDDFAIVEEIPENWTSLEIGNLEEGLEQENVLKYKDTRSGYGRTTDKIIIGEITEDGIENPDLIASVIVEDRELVDSPEGEYLVSAEYENLPKIYSSLDTRDERGQAWNNIIYEDQFPTTGKVNEDIARIF